MKNYAIIVAGGSGTRMGSTIPKQFLIIEDRPIIAQTILRFKDFDPKIEIVVVLPEDHLAIWEKVYKEHLDGISIQTTIGGATRTKSVQAGLKLVVDEDSLVAIHDAVRPFITTKIIQKSFESAKNNGSGVVAVSLKDSIREKIGNSSKARDRSNYVLIQTPQTFKSNLIKRAYDLLEQVEISDDATVFEMAGYDIYLTNGSYSNIKITTPEDLVSRF